MVLREQPKSIPILFVAWTLACTEPKFVPRDDRADTGADATTTQEPTREGGSLVTFDAAPGDTATRPTPTDVLGTCERLCDAQDECGCSEALCADERCVDNCIARFSSYQEPDCLSSLNAWLSCVERSPCTSLASLGMHVGARPPPAAPDCVEEAISVHCGDEFKAACFGLSCDPVATCVAIEGAPQCACPPGFGSVPSPTPGVRCEDIDECQAPDACGEGAVCANTFGSHRCTCADGYAADPKGDCIPLEDCFAGDSWTFDLYIEGDGRGEVEVRTSTCAQRCRERMCRFLVPPRDSLTIHSSADPYSLAVRVTPNSCGLDEQGNGPCQLLNDGSSATVGFWLAHNAAFVTSTKHNGNLGGLDGADRICASRAREAGLGGSRWVALLGLPNRDALSRIITARGWVRTDGMPLLDRPPLDALLFPLALDEHAQPVPKGDKAWGEGWDGDHCAEWTSAAASSVGLVGDPHTVSNGFLFGRQSGCDAEAHLYCFRADTVSPLPSPAPFPGRVAFATRTHFALEAPSSDVLQRADAFCQREACKLGLTGRNGDAQCDVDPSSERRFVALLGNSSTSALARVRSSAGPWTNELRLPWIPEGGDLATGTYVNALSAGRDLRDANWAFVGFQDDPNALDGMTCQDWSNPQAMSGHAWHLWEAGRLIAPVSCDGAALICIED